MKLYKTLVLDYFDIIFLIGFLILIIYLIPQMSVLTFGGLILILGAWLVYKGEIFLSMFAYIAADISWIINAFNNHDIQAVVFIGLGITFGVMATFKMQIGQFTKNLKKEK